MPASDYPSPPSPLLTGLPGMLDDPVQRHELANGISQRGIALLSADDTSLLPEALHCFEKAIVLRRDLPLEENLWFRWGLSAGWMNRGDVLTRMRDPDLLPEAVRSYDEAIRHLEKMPVVEEPNVPGRHALAWMNRAITLRAQRTPESLAEALRSLGQATALLETHATPERPLDPMTQATLGMNRSALLLEVSPPRMLEAMKSADEVLVLCHPLESTDLLAAEVGLKARHAYCHAVAMLLESPPVDTRHADDWILQATERVEEAMSLTARWSGQGHAFKELRLELFHYGCRIYLAYQPQFMAEFLLDVLDPEQGSPLLSQTEDLHAAGIEALSMAAEVLKRRGPLDFGLQGVDRLLEVITSLNAAAERIKKLPTARAGG
ncbi:MAG: hypothetical protein ACO1TE_08685 [Prosthecobacter sp.]